MYYLTFFAFALGLLASAFLSRYRRSPLRALDVDLLAAALPAIIYTVGVLPDGSLRWHYLSKNVEGVAGLPWDELNKEERVSFPGYPNNVGWLSTFFLDVLRDDRATREYKLRQRDDTWRWMQSIAVCVDRHSAGGGLILGVVLDISPQHAVDLKLKELENRASLADYVSVLSHELRQPVSTIAMAAENGMRALTRAPAAVGYAGEKFSRIGSQVARIESILTGFRTLAAYNVDFELKGADLGTVVEAALEDMRATLVQDGINVYIDIQSGLSPVFCNPVILTQVFINIIQNTCDAYLRRPEFDVRPIYIAARQDGAIASISVSDVAGGITEELISHIFKPFVTGNVSGRTGGIGLTIAQISLNRMGGHILAKNADNGIRIEIRLPTLLATAGQ